MPSFLTVGIGASAGGLAAFSEVLRNLPSDTGSAYVYVQHLAPFHVSHLAELFSRCTSMRVSEVQDGDVIEPNRVFIIPPNRDLRIEAGTLYLSPRTLSRNQHMSIDTFFDSLAVDQRHLAVAVILTGYNADGSRGVTAIRSRGGMTIAHDPISAAHPSMPRNAIATGHVDSVLSLRMIGRHLSELASKLPPPAGYIRYRKIEYRALSRS